MHAPPWKNGCFGWEWVRAADDAIALLKTGNVEEASLDHDLTEQQAVRGGRYGAVYDDGHSTGYDVLCWLEANSEFWPPKGVRVHSTNAAGAARMREVIERHYLNKQTPAQPAPLGILRAREREETLDAHRVVRPRDSWDRSHPGRNARVPRLGT